MWPDQVSNPGPLALESDALLTSLHGPAFSRLTERETVLLTGPLELEPVTFSIKTKRSNNATQRNATNAPHRMRRFIWVFPCIKYSFVVFRTGTSVLLNPLVIPGAGNTVTLAV